MKWPQGLAVITRAEHWDLASKHLWGLSGSDIAAYLHVAPPPKPICSIEPAKIQSCSEISSSGSLGSNLERYPLSKQASSGGNSQ